MEMFHILLLAFAAILYFNACDGCSCWSWRDPIEASYCGSCYVMEAKIVNYTDSYTEDVSDLSIRLARNFLIRTYDIDIKHLYRHSSSYTSATKQLRAHISCDRFGQELFLDHTYFIAGYCTSYPFVEIPKTFLSFGSCNYVVDLDGSLDLKAVKDLTDNLPTCA